MFFGLRACFADNNLATREPSEQIDAALTLNAVTLEQPDEDGMLLWRLKAKSIKYVPDTQRADLIELEGEFFQDGEVVYTIEADEGEVVQNGDQLFLRGNLIAKGTENELTLEGEKLKWLPRKDLLVMGEFDDDVSGDELPSEVDVTEDERATTDELDLDSQETAVTPLNRNLVHSEPLDIDNAPVTGFNPQIKTVARLIRVNNRKNEVELLGSVLAESKASPWITFESESLLWLTQQQLIEADNPLQVEQFASDAYQTVTDRVVGQAGEVDLAENTVTLDRSVTVESLTQPLIVQSEQAIWDVDGEMVEINSPVNIEQPKRQITAQAQQASLDLAAEVVYLVGNVPCLWRKERFPAGGR